jgi:hypothetical protein
VLAHDLGESLEFVNWEAGMVTIAQALVDAATAHGAGRYLSSASSGGGTDQEQDVTSPFDRFLFSDFLHHALLYDRLSVVSSQSNNHRDVDDLILGMNEMLGSDFLSLEIPDWDRRDTPGFETAVIRRLCNLVRERATDAFKLEVSELHIPNIYFTDHQDLERLSAVATEIGMEPSLIPYALYCFRGICYAGMSLPLSERRNAPTVYVASPGRLSALEKILSVRSLETFRLPRSAYDDLLALLRLPRAGYDFSFLELSTGPITQVAAEVELLSPREAIEWVAAQRQSPEGHQVRKAWTDRIVGLGPWTAIQQQTKNGRAGYLAAYAASAYGST